MEYHLLFQPLFFEGMSGSMSAVTGVIAAQVGPSVLRNLLAGLLSWCGAVLLYRVAREEVEPDGIRPALLGIFFVPSVAFWCGSLTKEAIIMGGFGAVALSTYRILKGFQIQYLPALVAGSLIVALIKPYVPFPFVLSVSAWIYAAMAWKAGGSFRAGPAYLVLAGALAVGGIAAMGSLFPDFAAGNVAVSISQQQELWQTTEAGSNVELGSGEARTFAQQLPFVPIA